MERRFAVREQLAGVVRSGLGGDLRIADVTRLQGGSKKGVYRLSLDNGSSVIAYIWDATENYWPDHQADDLEDRASPFSPASGLDLFEAAHRRLGTLGIRTPQIYWTDAGKEHYPADVALVEDVDGGTLETLLHHDSESAKSVLTRLAEALRTMRRQRGASLGKVAFVDHGGISEGRSCEQVVLDRALDDLAEAASRDTRLAAARSRNQGFAKYVCFCRHVGLTGRRTTGGTRGAAAGTRRGGAGVRAAGPRGSGTAPRCCPPNAATVMAAPPGSGPGRCAAR